jgi:hypothetical protein
MTALSVTELAFVISKRKDWVKCHLCKHRNYPELCTLIHIFPLTSLVEGARDGQLTHLGALKAVCLDLNDAMMVIPLKFVLTPKF